MVRPMRGVMNIIIGIVLVVGGLTGRLALRGTQSGAAIAVVGGCLVAYGIYRMAATRR
jgi:hypothetical protein